MLELFRQFHHVYGLAEAFPKGQTWAPKKGDE
jgi:hypothetical protein